MTTGLDNIKLFVDHLGHPETKFPSIHIAGTNGKGSVTAILDSILRSAGLSVGRYTSPHILRFEERIHINGQPVSEEVVFGFLETHWDLIQEKHFTFFETATAMAFQTFADVSIDIAVVEVGLGGTHDATRIVNSVLSLFTSIDIDHTDRLGKELIGIAQDKAGIMRSGVPVVIADQHPEVNDVLSSSAQKIGSVLYKAEETVQFTSLQLTSEGIIGSAVINGSMAINSFHLPLTGSFQIDNLKLALAACSILSKRYPDITTEAITDGLENTHWPGRLQVLQNSPTVILDVAHNPAALKRVLTEVKSIWKPNRIITIFGVMADKDVSSMIAVLANQVDKGILVSLKCERSLNVEDLQEIADQSGWNAESASSVEDSINRAHKAARPGDVILIAGSHYLAEEVLKTEIYS